MSKAVNRAKGTPGAVLADTSAAGNGNGSPESLDGVYLTLGPRATIQFISVGLDVVVLPEQSEDRSKALGFLGHVAVARRPGKYSIAVSAAIGLAVGITAMIILGAANTH